MSETTVSKKGSGTECYPPPPCNNTTETCISAEDVFSQKIDMCFTDAAMKTGASMLIGGLTSVMFFRGRRWPMMVGMGVGIGLAWANCEHELNIQTKANNF